MQVRNEVDFFSDWSSSDNFMTEILNILKEQDGSADSDSASVDGDKATIFSGRLPDSLTDSGTTQKDRNMKKPCNNNSIKHIPEIHQMQKASIEYQRGRSCPRTSKNQQLPRNTDYLKNSHESTTPSDSSISLWSSLPSAAYFYKEAADSFTTESLSRVGSTPALCSEESGQRKCTNIRGKLPAWFSFVHPEKSTAPELSNLDSLFGASYSGTKSGCRKRELQGASLQPQHCQHSMNFTTIPGCDCDHETKIVRETLFALGSKETEMPSKRKGHENAGKLLLKLKRESEGIGAPISP